MEAVEICGIYYPRSTRNLKSPPITPLGVIIFLIPYSRGMSHAALLLSFPSNIPRALSEHVKSVLTAVGLLLLQRREQACIRHHGETWGAAQRQFRAAGSEVPCPLPLCLFCAMSPGSDSHAELCFVFCFLFVFFFFIITLPYSSLIIRLGSTPATPIRASSHMHVKQSHRRRAVWR